MARSVITRLFRNKDGVIGPLFGLLALAVFALPGAALDLGRAISARYELQTAADAAAVTGAREVAYAGADAQQSASVSFSQNMVYQPAGQVTPSIVVEGNQVSVDAATEVPTTVLRLFGINSLPVSVTARAEIAYETVTTPSEGGNVCILLMDDFKHQSLLLNGSMWASAPDCEVHVKSRRTSEAVMVNSNVHFDVKKTCMEGGVRVNGGGNGVVGPLEESCQTADDPFASRVPVPTAGSCKASQNFNGNAAYLTPGTYCGNWNFNGNIKNIYLSPGLYYFNNARWTFNGKLHGDEVTIYYADSNSYMQLNGQGTIDVTAPLSGTYEGLLIYENPTIQTKTRITINGGQDAKMRGLVYLPSRDMTWNGNSGVDGDALTMVFNSLILNGNTTWRVKPFETWNVKAPGSGETRQVVKGIRIGEEP